MNEQIPDFIKNLNKKDATLGSSSQKGFVSTIGEQIPDFISKPISKSTDAEYTSVKPDLKDIEVRQELGIDFDNSFSSNEEAVKEYVDNLSDEDYKTWTNLKNEGYSLDARKAMFDNREDLYDINAKGNEKFWSGNKNSFMQYLLDQQQGTLDFQNEIIHPWSVTTQEKLNTISQNLMTPTYDDIYNKLETDYAGNSWNKSMAGVLRGINIAGGILTNLLSKGVNLVDNLGNLSTQLGGELLNAIADDEKGYNEFIVDPSQSVSLRASQIQAVNDVLGVGFTVKYPIATYIITTLGSESETVQKIMDGSYKGIKWVTQQVVDALGEETLGLANLSEQDREIWYENVAMAVMIMFGEALGYGGKKISNSKIIQEANGAIAVAKEVSKFSKRTAENEIAQGVKGAMRDLPEGAQLTTEGGTPMFTNTAAGIKPTLQGNIWLLTKLGGARVNGFIRGLERVYKNKDKWLVTRNPNEPVGDLPFVPGIKPETNTPKLEGKSTELAESKPTEIKVEQPKIETPKTITPKVEQPKTSTLGKLIKEVKEDVKSLGKSGLSEELVTKLETSPALQSEYINTIDPYIKANGSSNPEGVIQQQLQDFVNTIKEELQFMRNSDKDKMINDMKTKINIPNLDKAKYNASQNEYKDLIKVLSQEIEKPEQFLKYLLNLPKETTNTLNRLIPDYSKNLGLIKDTLDLTKAITSSDLLGKFLDFKSTRGTKNKNFIRKYLYKKLAEIYKENNTKKRMAEVEQILNQMSEEEIAQLEKDAQNGTLEKWGSDEDWRSEGYMKETMGEKGNRLLKEVMDSKRPGTDKTVGEYLESKGVKITAVDDSATYRQITKELRENESLAAYSENLDRMILKKFDNPYKGFLFHEFGHRLFNQLGTSQMFDMLEYISKRDNISQEAAFERRAEYFRNYMEYNNIDGKRYILKELGEAFDPKLLQVIEKTKNEVFDLFNIKDAQELEINQIMSDVKHDTEAGKEITSRKPQPLLSKRVGEDVDRRTEWLSKFDNEVKQVIPDYLKGFKTVYDKGDIVIQKNDGTTESRNSFKKKIPEEELKKIDKYEEDALNDIIGDLFKIDTEEGIVGEGKFDYKTLSNKNNINQLISKALKKTKEDLGLETFQAIDYIDQLRDIDPDIIGLGEKDGQLTVKFLEQSYWERREQADRPGQREIKEAPAIDFFTEEEISKFPKELQDEINRDEGVYQGNQGGLNYSEGKNLKLGNGYYFGSKKQANEFGPALIRLEKNKDWKLKEFKDTQDYQVEASKNGGKEEYNKKLKEEGYDGIKAYNKSFKSDEYNFFTNPFIKNAN